MRFKSSAFAWLGGGGMVGGEVMVGERKIGEVGEGKEGVEGIDGEEGREGWPFGGLGVN